MKDEEIIKQFLARSDHAICELDAKYGKYARRLSFRILNNQQDSEECVNDAYLGVWNAIPPKHPDSLAAFLYKIVRNQSLMRYHANTAQKRSSIYEVALEELEGCLASSNTVETELEAKELAHIIENFLDTLNTENRAIFLRRYWFADSYSDIAKRTGLTEKTVSVRLTRNRKKLRKYLRERGIPL